MFYLASNSVNKYFILIQQTIAPTLFTSTFYRIAE